MKKRMILPLMFAFAVMASACSSDTTQTTTAAAAVVTEAESTDTQSSDVQSFSGVLEAKKNVSFIVTNTEGVSYSFTFETEDKAPEGYDTVNEGDTVTVEYVGELSEIDPNMGAVSIKKN
ncbi:hypothetical protein [Bacteroides heparinolyticus]|uniref:hypothetical protein n=1 Tax=Prevotella heparinolytica TaxID=28113 RepID=UPI0035A0312E